jgi:cell wall-associated NlpC family hydrolase
VRPLSSGRPLVLTAAALLLLGGLALPAVADPGSDDGSGTPTKSEVEAARDAVAGQKRTVAAVQTDLVLANQRLERAAIKAAQAAEAYNAARWKLAEARAAVRTANARAIRAEQLLAKQQEAYGEVVATTYEMSPELSSMNAVLGQDGLEGVIDTANTAYQTTTTLDEIRSSYDAAVEVADLATNEAEQARQHAAGLAEEADAARDRASAQEAAAASEATRVAKRKRALIAELADLQDISVKLAARRQAGLEAAAQARAAAAAEAEQAAAAAEEAANQQPPKGDDDQANDPPSDDPTTEPQPDPEPQPDQTPPTPSTSGAQRAISFARAQLGEPYKWGADGPGSWDCSGLTMGAWQAGGKYLPHYSVGQYDVSTPISSSQLQPGDLVFWGSSSSPGSIYHVALYIGGGRIIHAPRTGRPVTEDSMYYWIPPNFFARP